ncbi:MAG: response regulator transcription factor, partial [Calditrichaeota bacterium]|nr:response regulator transcription factor [Calditrichota bacterium]
QQLDFLTTVACCSNAIEALNKLKSEPIDILFLDIRMPQINGIDLVRMLDKPPKVILTTAFKEFALIGYELDVVDYLMKPISFERFMQAVNKAMGRIETTEFQTPQTTETDQFIFVKSDKQMRKLYLSEILFIEGLKDYIQIVLRKEKVISYLSLKYMEAKLPERYFLRVHRSYIINTDNIDSFSASEIHVMTHKIPIGRYYKKNVQDFLAQTIK